METTQPSKNNNSQNQQPEELEHVSQPVSIANSVMQANSAVQQVSITNASILDCRKRPVNARRNIKHVVRKKKKNV